MSVRACPNGLRDGWTGEPIPVRACILAACDGCEVRTLAEWAAAKRDLVEQLEAEGYTLEDMCEGRY